MQPQSRTRRRASTPAAPETSPKIDTFIGDVTEQDLGDSIFASINDAILVINSEAVIEPVNPATLELTGFAEHELVATHVGMLTRNRHFFERMFAKSLHKSIVGNRFEMKCRRKDGSLFP